MIIGIKSGRWELIHRAHIETLEECATQCDKLIVLVHDCKTKPSFLTAEDRKYIIERLHFVWKVYIYTENTEDNLVRTITKTDPNRYYIMFHSEELIDKLNSNIGIPGYDSVNEVRFIKRKTGSTTELIRKIKDDGK